MFAIRFDFSHNFECIISLRYHFPLNGRSDYFGLVWAEPPWLPLTGKCATIASFVTKAKPPWLLWIRKQSLLGCFEMLFHIRSNSRSKLHRTISLPVLFQKGRLHWHTRVFDKSLVDLSNYPPFRSLKGYSVSNQIQEVNFIERSVILCFKRRRLLWHKHVFEKSLVDSTNYPPFRLLKVISYQITFKKYTSLNDQSSY